MARAAFTLAASLARVIRCSACRVESGRAAWYASTGMRELVRSMRRRSTTLGEAGSPASVTAAAHPVCARNPIAAGSNRWRAAWFQLAGPGC